MLSPPGRFMFDVDLVTAVLAGLAFTQDGMRNGPWKTAGIVGVALQLTFRVALTMPGRAIEPSSGRWRPMLVLLVLFPCAIFRAYGDLSERAWCMVCLGLLVIELFIVWQPLVRTIDIEKALPDNSVARFLEEMLKWVGPSPSKGAHEERIGARGRRGEASRNPRGK